MDYSPWSEGEKWEISATTKIWIYNTSFERSLSKLSENSESLETDLSNDVLKSKISPGP